MYTVALQGSSLSGCTEAILHIMTAEAFLPPSRRRSFSVPQQHLNSVQRWDGQATAALTQPPSVTFTGKVLIVVCPYAMGVDPYIEGAHGTYALCSCNVRSAAREGDVVIAVSPPASSGKTRGLKTSERLLLSLGIVEGTLAAPTYHSLATPAWAMNRGDRVYRATSMGSGSTVEGRRVKALFASATFRRLKVKRAHVKETQSNAWEVDYGNMKVRFILRSRARYHGLDNLNRVYTSERHRDFSGHVLISQCCRTYPSKGEDVQSLPACLRKSAYYGQGFRVVWARRGSALRNWLSTELGHAL